MRSLRSLIVWVGLAGCTVAPPPPRGVILVSIDTLRADHLGCYGYRRPTSPELDRLARDGLLFERVSAAAPSTLLSHASIFTSTIPQRHGASHVRRLPLPANDLTTLAEAFSAAGWRTAAFHDGGQLAPEFGLHRGFDLYERVLHDGPNADFEDTVERSLAWLDDSGSALPFFLFLHTYEVHHPYLPKDSAWKALAPPGLAPEPIEIEQLKDVNHGRVALTESLAERIVLAYDAGIRSVDDAFGRLRAGLEARNLWERCLIVVTSDHGEELGEHGWMGWHSHTVFEELLRVPLIIFGSSTPAGRAAGWARSIDIAPTLLALAQVDRPPTFDGIRLVPLDRSLGRLPAIALGETEQRRMVAVRIGRWKLADGRLFDLDADPGERRDLAASEPARLESLAARGSTSEQPSPVRPAPLDPETERSLRALGYGSGGAP